MTEQNFEIDVCALVRGMEQIDREKNDIKKVVGFLASWIFDMATEEFKIRVSTPMYDEYNFDLFVIKNDAENDLRIRLSDLGGNGYMYDLSYFVRNHIRIRLLEKRGRERTNLCDGLASKDVHACHALLQPLIAMVRDRFPNTFPDALTVFYDAAKRAIPAV
jgi:hypothetical protein